MSKSSANTGDLLEFAANNDVEAFKRSIELDTSSVDEPGIWYVRKNGSNRITQEERTPLMIAATYGSVNIVRLLVAIPEIDLNKTCSKDKWTALHCATSGGSVNAVCVVKLLLSSGAEPNIKDSTGQLPIDVITTPIKLLGYKSALKEILRNNMSEVSSRSSNDSPPVLSSPLSSPTSPKLDPYTKKQYPIDPSLPDIHNGIYLSDEFRMFSFKIIPCSRAYSHDWTECPFAHPGENAKRRDPRKYNYSCLPCPNFRKGSCQRGDGCEYAHGVFECWLHPDQYRTKLCKDGTDCTRHVCFFAHTKEELRSMGGVNTFMDMAAALRSPSGAFGQSVCNGTWSQPNVPTLQLPGSNMMQSSRLRSSFNGREIPQEDMYSLGRFTQSNTTLIPSNLEKLLLTEMALSPRFPDRSFFSPTHKSAVRSHFPHNRSTLSPIKTNVFSPRNAEHPFLHAPLGVSSPRMMSPRNTELLMPMGAYCEKQQQQMISSLSSRDLGSKNRSNADWSTWGSPTGKVDWSVNGNNHNSLKNPSLFDLKNNGVGPDLSRVQSRVKETPPEMMEKFAYLASVAAAATSGECLKSNCQINPIDGLLERMHLD